MTLELQNILVQLAYLLASILFILGLKGLTHPRTAVRGNMYGAAAMLIAVVATLVHQDIMSFELIIGGLALGTVLGLVLAVKIQMTAMPQLVAIFNGFGGAASALVAATAVLNPKVAASMTPQMSIAIIASGVIGAVTLTGSLVAFAKLQELTKFGGIPGQQFINGLLALGTVGMAVMVFLDPTNINLYWGLLGLTSILGITLTIPIGGADMPVAIALLNSYSGLAAAATGFVLTNNVLIIAGSLVGASGIILTQIMCKAMNRSLANVIFPTQTQAATGGASADDVYAGKIKSTSADEVAMILETAERVVVVPGYGLAVAQAQHAVRDLGNALAKRGIEVEYGIHPVAGRMPGHMNVLLAEADIPYEQLKEMELINSSFQNTDVALVIGANDVVNPVAREDPTSPIAGMPILDVDKARTVVVIKRSLSPGFAGIPNPLFAADNCLMLFGDGKKVLSDLNAAVAELD